MPGRRIEAQGDFAFVSRPESNRSRSAHRRSASEEDREESAPTPPRDRKKLTLFRFDPKLGDVSVQPVIGSVNGAQLSVRF